MSARGWWTAGAPRELVEEVATPVQLAVYTQAEGGKTIEQIAGETGVSVRNVQDTLTRLRKNLARRGWSPESGMVHPVAPGQFVKGVSTLYDEQGQRLQWVKTDTDKQIQYELAQEALRALCDEIEPVDPVPAPESKLPEDLCNLFVVTDYHLGMQAWGEETRDADWDTSIAERLLVAWFKAAIERMPDAQTAVFAQLGDFLHWDGLDSVTPMSGHILDADTRFQKLVRVAIRALRQCTEILLRKHEHVHLIMAEGNHDMASSVWLREMFSAFYELEPRVTVDLSPDPYYVHQHGNTGLYFHHGHKRKTRELDRVFAAKFREIYGQCEHNYGHSGHYHFDKQETSLMTIEQHRTLAASDAYASRGGWLSGRGAKGITYHSRYGEVGRVIITPEMVQ